MADSSRLFSPSKVSGLPAHLSILREIFGYEQFRGPQQAIVEHVIGGGDALVLMPTGGGKSLCYQVPAIVRQRQGQGVTIVVSPLIALMHAAHNGHPAQAYRTVRSVFFKYQIVLRSLPIKRLQLST